MTTRELYNATINALRDYNTDEANELIAEFEAAIAKMDAQATARRAKQAEKAAEKQAEKAPIRDALLEVMGDVNEPKTASMLIEEAGLTDTVKPASVPSLMRPLVESGIVLKVDVKITGKGTQRGYVKA
jgi:regulator of protease activity HflC (stomatin/prohibitin superfamily)